MERLISYKGHLTYSYDTKAEACETARIMNAVATNYKYIPVEIEIITDVTHWMIEVRDENNKFLNYL